jgi:hypothetical protein
MNNVSTYLRNQIVNCVLLGTAYTAPTHVYLALYTSDPTTEDAGTEILANGYVRQQITFGAPISAGSGSGVCLTTVDITFPQATGAQSIGTHGGIRDALSGGNLLFFGPLSQPQAIAVAAFCISGNGLMKPIFRVSDDSV